MLNEALRLLRVFHDMKSIELAKELEISNSYLSEIEKGKKTPSVDIINKYSRIFSIKSSSILFFSEKMESDSFKSKAKNAIRNKMIFFLQCIENAKP